MYTKAPFNIQPVLENEKVLLHPLKEDDFDLLYNIASDPLIWEQHPNPDRWKKDVFQNFFKGAMDSQGAFLIMDKSENKAIGSTRFYDYSESNNSIFIGYTFYDRKYWGTGINHSVKKLMMDYLFTFLDNVDYHIGAQNIRSQISLGRLGAQKIGEEKVAYVGEEPRLNFHYRIRKSDWQLT